MIKIEVFIGKRYTTTTLQKLLIHLLFKTKQKLKTQLI